MRNLKRVLALALAVVMMIGMMATASAAVAENEVDEDYYEAAQLLADMGVFKGTDKGYEFDKKLTREEGAALVYRVITGDVKDEDVDLYDYSSFADVEEGYWSTAYITYAANGGYIKGWNNEFHRTDALTGVQMLAIMLRALGYGQNGEYEGDAWKDNVLTDGREYGISGDLKGNDLDKAADRGMVAQIMFNALNAETVTYSMLFGYRGTGDTLGEKIFDLEKDATQDKWGRPGYTYTYNVGEKSTTFTYEPDAVYTTAVTECKIAEDVKLKADTTYTMYTNGYKGLYAVQLLDTVQKIGGQGTLVEVYDDDVIVVIDTLLAKVTNVSARVYDAAGHLRVHATIELEVYDNTTSKVLLTNAEADYTYTKGQYVLINAYMDTTLTTGEFESTEITTKTPAVGQTVGEAAYAEILGVASSIEGAQTFFWYNAAQHTVNGTVYNDAEWFKLDEAVAQTAKHNWFFDQYGNLIGATDIATIYAYGIVENIQWQNPVLALGYAQATIRYMDGTTATQVVSKIGGNNLTYTTTGTAPSFAAGTISTSMAENASQCGNDLYRITTDAKGTLILEHVFTDTDGDGVKDDSEPINEIANANIYNYGTTNTLAIITNGTASIYTNANTKFLIQTVDPFTNAKTYTVVEGYQNLPAYTANSAVVDWVNTTPDSYADLVYIRGTADANTADGLFFMTSPNVQVTVNDGIKNVILTGMVDGIAGTITINGAATVDNTNDSTANGVVVNAMDAADFAAMNNKMFVVEYTGGNVTSMTIAAAGDLSSQNVDNKAYTGVSLDIYNTTADAATYDGYVLAVTKSGVKYTFNVVDLTPVVGQFTPVMNNQTLYVLYTDPLGSGTDYLANAAYVVNNGTSGSAGGSGTSTNGYVNYVVDVYSGGTLIGTVNKVWNGPAGVYGNQSWTNIGAAHFPTLAAATAVIDNATVTVAAGTVSTLKYVVVI